MNYDAVSNKPAAGEEAVMWEMIRCRSLALLVPPFLAVAAGVPSQASAVDDANVIHACKQKNHGTLRVVGDPGECKTSEVAISWNITGPAGTEGSALAYARVDGDGALDTARSKNVVSMTMVTRVDGVSTNIIRFFYCFEITETPKNAMATPEFPESPSVSTTIPAVAVAGTSEFSSTPCPAGTNAAVQYGWERTTPR